MNVDGRNLGVIYTIIDEHIVCQRPHSPTLMCFNTREAVSRGEWPKASEQWHLVKIILCEGHSLTNVYGRRRQK